MVCHGWVARHGVAGGGRVTLLRSGHTVSRQVSEALLPLVLLAALLAFLLARWLARPFQQLADVAGQLGRGRFDVDVPHFSVPEAERIGAALRSGSRQLDERLRREREFAANASHQLRTPITALRLELEDLTLWPATPPDVTEQLHQSLGELDRLSTAIDQLLDLARGQRLGDATDLDLAALVTDITSRWQPQLASLERTLRVTTGADEGVVPARLVPGPVTQILDVLLGNAMVHGTGTVTVTTQRLADHLRVTVADQGTRSFGNEVFGRGTSSGAAAAGVATSGHGIGLTVAAELAESLGGHLSLAETPTTSFVLMLPRPDPIAPAPRRRNHDHTGLDGSRDQPS
ncbi:MAG: sensor histidine kinase [Marmoricola sp.]